VDATYRAVRSLLDDRGLCERVAAQAMVDAENRSWRRAAEQLVDVYERACARRPGR